MDIFTFGIGIALGLLAALLSKRVASIGPGFTFVLMAFGGAWAIESNLLPDLTQSVITIIPPDGEVTKSRLTPFTANTAVLVVAAIVYRLGLLLGTRLRSNSAFRNILISFCRIGAKIFLIGGIAYSILPWSEKGFDENPYRAAFLLSAGWALFDPLHRLQTRQETENPQKNLQDQALWGILFGLVFLSLFRYWPSQGSTSTISTFDIRGFLNGSFYTVSGSIGSGLMGWILIKGFPGHYSRLLIHISSIFVAMFIAKITGGEPLISAMIAGIVHAGLIPHPFTNPLADSWMAGAMERSWDALQLVGGLLLFLAAGFLFPEIIRWHSVQKIFLLWIIATVIQILLMSTSSYFSREKVSGSSFTRAWSYHPGFLAIGAMLAMGFLSENPSANFDPALTTATISFDGAFLQFILIAVFLQGSTVNWLQKWQRRGQASPETLKNWEKLEGRWLILRATLGTIQRLHSEGLISDGGAAAISKSFQKDLRNVELERQEYRAKYPVVEQSRWTQTIRALLEEARQTMESAQAQGRISPQVAEKIYREISEKWENADLQKLMELFRNEEYQ